MPTVSAFSSTNYLSANDGGVQRISSFTTSFTSLGVPTGATINGFKFTVRLGKAEGGDVSGAVWKVQKGSGDSATLSSAKSINESSDGVEVYESFSDVTIGASNDLWGLSWNVTEANAVQLVFNAELVEGFSTVYLESAQCEIDYTAAASGGGTITHTSGLILIKQGKITL